MNDYKKFISAILSLISCYSLNAQDCGEERWNVKTLSDIDTLYVNFNEVIKSSVHEQVNLCAPFGKLESRLASETKVYSIDCLIVGFKKESDKDIHIIVEDINTDETMVIEMISSDCLAVQNIRRFEQMKKLSDWFNKNIGVPHTSFTFLSQHKLVTITGVGFWDFLHGQKGMAENGREIHPVLSMMFKQ